MNIRIKNLGDFQIRIRWENPINQHNQKVVRLDAVTDWVKANFWMFKDTYIGIPDVEEGEVIVVPK